MPLRRTLVITRYPGIASAIAIAVLLGGRTAHAQAVPNRESAVEMRARFLKDLDSLQSRFLALAEAFPAEKYAWRPAPGVRSVGEVFMHVASEYYLYAPLSYGATPSPVIGRGQEAIRKFESQSTRADAERHLREGFTYMKQAIEALDPAAITGSQRIFGRDRTILETSLVMAGDLHEHLGQLIAYARMNSVKPPWTP
ncbi:MAG TPA: DinB family protein [Gemmatimonadaceae bacterium]|nr:DinB family protein [Gemmatimonadaceae bacterium]